MPTATRASTKALPIIVNHFVLVMATAVAAVTKVIRLIVATTTATAAARMAIVAIVAWMVTVAAKFEWLVKLERSMLVIEFEFTKMAAQLVS